MIKKLNNRKSVILLLVLFCIALIVAFSQRIEAAVTGQETTQTLIGTRVGRYRLNYTGNTNFYDVWNTSGGRQVGLTYNDLGGSYVNSSVAALNRSTGTSTIKYAYLVWETRSSKGPTTPIVLVTPNGRAGYVYPDYAVNDWREDTVNHSWAYQSLYCMAVDVTAIVQSSGYGNYAVCNIPRYEENGSYTAGESPGSWQLIVVEEDDSFPVSAVKLDMGARFYMGKDFGSQLTLGNGLKSKSVGTTTGQVFFGASNSGRNEAMTENVTTYNSVGGMIEQAVSNTTYSAGLYKNGNLINNRDYANGCIRMDLSDVNNIGNNANRIELTVQNTGWTTSFLLGMAVDIDYPDFSGTQTTTVNSSDSVTVTGSFMNTAVTANTGIYNGNLTITLDDALSAQSASAVVNGTTTIQPTSIAGNQVIFSGAAVASMMNGSTISYTVQCAANNAGKTAFYNDAGFQGYLRSDGVSTGYWIDRMWTASSSGVPKYTLTVESGTGIESVSGAGEYPYGGTVNIRADVKPGYHWMGWNSGTFATSQSHSFTMPNKDIIIRADAEANTYTIVFNVNGGAEVTHLENITVHYGEEMILPDGGVAYKKYTLDGVNVTPDVLSGLLSLGSMPETEESETEELETQPEEGKRDKTAYESVYRGWSLEEEKDYFEPQLTPGAADIAHLADLAGVTDQNGAVITLYAVWDDCPWITAHTLYYKLEQAQRGFITAEEILSHAAASDREDGSPIAAGFHENGTSFSIPDYTPEDFTTFTDTGACTENLTVVDSSGSVYVKQIWVWVVNTEPQDVPPEGTTRFINEYYYYQPYELGGLADDSLWKTDPEYVKAITEAFENLKNDTPIESYHFTHEDILEMREYIDEHGFGNSKEPDALRNFYDRFMAPNRTK